MDLARQLKQGMNTGTILFGQRQTMGACSKGGSVELFYVPEN